MKKLIVLGVAALAMLSSCTDEKLTQRVDDLEKKVDVGNILKTQIQGNHRFSE